jgi:hypothetical protein
MACLYGNGKRNIEMKIYKTPVGWRIEGMPWIMVSEKQAKERLKVLKRLDKKRKKWKDITEECVNAG